MDELLGERTWAQRIESVMEMVDGWQERTSASSLRASNQVHPGSELAADDARTQPWPTSAYIWTGLTMAVDHLGLAADSLRRVGGPTLRPYAFYSLCRAAMIPAARAVWLQLGIAEERRLRTLYVAWEEVLGAASFFEDFDRDESLGADLSDRAVVEVKTLLAKRREHIERIKAMAGAKPRTRKPPYSASTTAMLRDVAAEIAGDDAWLRRAYGSEWRLASGSAHGLMWPSLIRPGETLPGMTERTVTRVTTGTEEGYGMSFAGPAIALRHAWDLWDRRRQLPTTG